MSNGDLIKYSVFCKGTSPDFLDGHGYVDTEYMVGEPTVCPLNSNHEIDPLATTIIARYEINTTVAIDNTQGTNGIYEMLWKNFSIPASIGEHEILFNTPQTDTRVLMSELVFTTENLGDTATIIASPNTIVGVVTANVALGATVIPVSPTAIATIKPNHLISIGPLNEELGRAITVDTVNSTVTVSIATTSAYPAGTPIKLGLSRLTDMKISLPGVYKVGSGNNDTMLVPKNLPILIRYTNADGLAKEINLAYEFYY